MINIIIKQKKISDLEKEVKMLKKTNQDLISKVGVTINNSPNNYINAGISLNGLSLNPSITLDRK